ncbi:SRPBCC family protein [Streptomyces sp. NPDC015171]|uniref:SRPBCC family protein n=1 Tax=Streptomyces sp. NPDC015171 TaxID=3364945 RepID=UPI0036FB0A11
MRHTVVVSGPAAPAEVWERYARYDQWPRWAPHLREVTATGDRIAPGATGVVTSVGGVRARFVVTAVDEAGRTWSWQVTAVGVQMTLRHTVVPHGTGSRAVLDMTAPWPVPVLYAPLAGWALHRLTGS